MNTILFDLDGTLLPMDVEEFTKNYFEAIRKKMKSIGRDEQLILNGIFAGLHAMINNTHRQNEVVFWQAFTACTNIAKDEIEAQFYDFYLHDFDNVGKDNKKSQAMLESVQLLIKKGYRLILATNPLFPKIATEKRIKWAGLQPDDFDYITTYENSTACKPSTDYYKEVLKKNHLTASDCMMVGNDVKEDGIIETLQIPLFLVEDYLLNKEQLPIACRWHGSSQDFYEFVQNLPKIHHS